MRQRQDAAAKKTGNVKHRVIGEDHIIRAMRHDDRVGPALVSHAAMQDAHQLGCAGGAAAVHVGTDVVGLHYAPESQLVAGVLCHGQIEVGIRKYLAPRACYRKQLHIL